MSKKENDGFGYVHESPKFLQCACQYFKLFFSVGSARSLIILCPPRQYYRSPNNSKGVDVLNPYPTFLFQFCIKQFFAQISNPTA